MDHDVAKKGAGLCVGVSDYDDEKLTNCQAAAASAREVEQALDAHYIHGVQVVANPRRSDELFLALERAIRGAKGGWFFFYYAGHALRRGEDLLLTVGESELEGARGCVPWSDIEELLRRENVAQGLLILNVDHPLPGATPPRVTREELSVMGSARMHDPTVANARMRAYADALLDALRGTPPAIERYLERGQLHADALGRLLLEIAPKPVKHQVFSTCDAPLIVRDLTEALAKAKAAQAALDAAPAAPAPEPKEPAPEPEAPPAPAAKADEEPPAAQEKPRSAALERSREELATTSQRESKRASTLPLLLLVAAVVAAVLYWLLAGRG